MFIGAPDPNMVVIAFILFAVGMLFAKLKGFNPFGIYTNEKLHFILLIILFAYIGYKMVTLSVYP